MGGKGADPFKESGSAREKIGKIYLGLRENLPEGTAVVQVDPKNFLYLIPKLIHDLWVHRPPFLEGLKSLFMAYSFPALIVNGRVMHQGEIGDPESLVREIARQIAPKAGWTGAREPSISP